MLRSVHPGRRVDHRQRVRRYDLDRSLSDYIASGSARFLWAAFLLLPLALVCDVLDGYVARSTPQRQSVLCADLDWLADQNVFSGRCGGGKPYCAAEK